MTSSKLSVKRDLQDKSKTELEEQLAVLKRELLDLRIPKSNSKLGRIHDVRKNIARVKTVISQTKYGETRKLYLGTNTTAAAIRKAFFRKHGVSLPVRAKKTRAIRRKLTKFQASQKTLKQQKKDTHFPQRKYAIKA